jgi:hypothetical protein
MATANGSLPRLISFRSNYPRQFESTNRSEMSVERQPLLKHSKACEPFRAVAIIITKIVMQRRCQSNIWHDSDDIRSGCTSCGPGDVSQPPLRSRWPSWVTSTSFRASSGCYCCCCRCHRRRRGKSRCSRRCGVGEVTTRRAMFGSPRVAAARHEPTPTVAPNYAA